MPGENPTQQPPDQPTQQPPDQPTQQPTQVAPQPPPAPEPPTPPAPPVAEATPADPPQDPADPPNASGVLTIPQAAMARIKRQERDRGRKAAEAAMEAKAKELGFDSMEDMMAAAKTSTKIKRRTANAGTPPTPEEPARRVDSDELRRVNRARAREEAKRKAAEQRVQALEAEVELRTAAAKAGVKDVEYAIELLRRDVRKKTEEELQSYDENAFFTGLRKTHPYLFGVESAPAHSDPTPAGAAPTGDGAPPKPEGGDTPAPAPTPVDARKMSREEYDALLKKHKIRNPSLGV